MKTLEKDIILISKGWYDKKHKNEFEALKDYYMKNYNGEDNIDFVIDKRFLFNLFLKPTVIYFSKYDCNIISNILNPTITESATHTFAIMHNEKENKSIDEIMYDRSICALAMAKIKDLDFSDYSDVLNRKYYEDNKDDGETDGNIDNDTLNNTNIVKKKSCNNCKYCVVIPKKYPLSDILGNITMCKKYNKQLYYYSKDNWTVAKPSYRYDCFDEKCEKKE